MRVGLVFGAGGLPGEAFHRGVLRALLDVAGVDGRTAEVVVGTSAGALVAASLRAPRGRPPTPVPPTVEDGPVDGGQRAWVPPLPDVAALVGYARRPWRVRPIGLAAALLPPGRQSTAILSEPLRRRFGSEWPERDTWIVAARRRDGRRVVFGRDRFDVDFATAVAASCAMPGYFRPVHAGGTALVDGFVHSPTNADLLAGLRLDVVVVSAPMAVDPRELRPVLDLPFRLSWHARLRREVAALRRSGIPTLVAQPGGRLLESLGLSPVRAARLDEVEDLSYEAALPLARRLPAAEAADRAGRTAPPARARQVQPA